MKIRITAIIIVLLVIIGIGLIIYPRLQAAKPPERKSPTNTVKTFTISELAKYSGEDPSLPIYMGLDGKVYDVTAGSKYYKPGGSYHFLAGKDSSADLHAVKVDELIKSKYPVVGILQNN